jgi:hypothetical protein
MNNGAFWVPYLVSPFLTSDRRITRGHTELEAYSTLSAKYSFSARILTDSRVVVIVVTSR